MTLKQIGRYEVIEEVGRGGMATVYHGRDPRFNRDVAIKVLPQQMTHDPTFRARFEREAQTIAALEHPAIVPVYDYGEENEQPYLVMRYMSGGSLAERIRKGPLPLAEAGQIINRLARALDYAHIKGVIHRDLKPGNVLFDSQNNPYLADFGIAKLVEATTALTGSAVVGTPAYMSPEQVKGGQSIDGRSDVYALGIILFEMLTGHAPYRADTPIQVLMKHVLEPVPHIHDSNPNLPAAVDNVVARALAKEVAERYGTAGELAAAFATTANGLALPPTVATRHPANGRKIPIWVWAVSGVIGLLLAGWLLRPFFTPPIQEIVAATETAVPTATLPPTQPPSPEPTFTPTASSTPTLTASPEPTTTSTLTATALPRLRVTRNINLRSGPGTEYPVVGQLRSGDEVVILARDSGGDWLHVALSDDSTAWVSTSAGELMEGLQLTAVPLYGTLPPTPRGTTTPTRVTASPVTQTDTPEPNTPRPTNPPPTAVPPTAVPPTEIPTAIPTTAVPPTIPSPYPGYPLITPSPLG